MLRMIKNSFLKINYRLLFSLLVIGFVPTLYTTLRTFFLGQFPSEYSYSVAGQLAWVNLLYEILNEAIIFPLFFFVGRVITKKEELTNCVRSGMFITFCIYSVLSLLIIILINPLLSFMATNKDIVTASAQYIRIESVAAVFSVLANFALVVLVALNRTGYLYILTFTRLILTVLFDIFLVSDLDLSLKLGVNGIGFSNIIVNILILILSMIIMEREDVRIFAKQKLSFTWTKGFLKVGGLSGLESFVRNIVYMLMIVRMVNVVNEQGTYWVANNFIWGWFLLPVTQLGEYIKRDVATDKTAIRQKSLGYFVITAVICFTWFITIPFWKPFMQNILGFDDVDKLFGLVMVLVGFYVVYAFQNIFDATFYGLGKTEYMLFESIITNVIYYGGAFILYVSGIWTPTLTGIALLFGIGTAFDGLVSFGAYIHLLRKKGVSLFDSDVRRKEKG